MEIVWTNLAKTTYIEILKNLTKRWTKKELTDFRNLTNKLIESIRTKQVSHPFIHKKLKIKKGVIHKNVTLFYKENSVENKIYLITFFNNRMNPKTLLKQLKNQ